MILKNIYLLLFTLLLLSGLSHAQERNRAPRDSTMKNLPKIGKVSGLIRDSKTNKGVPYASVAVMSMRDSAIVGGALTDFKGNFIVEELPFGRLRLRITMLGYADKYTDMFLINPANQEVDAGIIHLEISATRLKEVDVTAEKADFINNIDRKVYNVDKNIVNTGGTVTEVLQNIPSVTVDMDGTVSLRGSANVNILIDGKPSGMLGSDRRAVLQQIPASAVEEIELITNPSAKYDASGMAGIINIKTKKDKMKGANGTVSAGVGTNDKYNVAAGGNNRTPKINLYTNISLRHESRSMTSESNQYNHFPGTAPYTYFNNSSGTSKSDFQTGKLGADFFVDPHNTIGINGSVGSRNENHPEQIQYRFEDSNQNIYSQFYKDNSGTESNRNADLNLDYKRTWAGSKRELTASSAVSTSKRTSDYEYRSSLYNYDGNAYQLSNNVNHFETFITQADLVQPIKQTGKLDAGLKNTMRKIDNDQVLSDYNPLGNDYLPNPLNSDHFIYNEQVLAAYSMYTGKWKKIDYNAGARVEQTLSDGTSKTQGTSFTNNYLSFFPSAFLKYTLSASQELQLSYSRRVNRPDTRALNPFVDYSDSLNIRKGNPYLKPEFIHSLEFSYTKDWGKLNTMATLYYRHTDDLITRYRSIDTATQVATYSSINYSTSTNAGAELIIRYQLGKAGSLMASFNIYKNKINGSNVQADLQSTATQWMSRLTANLRLSGTISMQLTGNYMSKMTNPTGTFKGMSGVDAGIKKDIWKGKGSLGLNVTDIFLMRKMTIYNYSDFYELNSTRTRESRVAMLNLTYRFGSQDANLFPKKKGQKQTLPQDSPEMIDY